MASLFKKIFVSVLLLMMTAPLFADLAQDEALKATLEKQYANSNGIHARYNTRFYWDDSDRVQVAVKDGVVTLRGIVQSSEAKNAFIQIARETPGVKEVQATIRIIPSARKVD